MFMTEEEMSELTGYSRHAKQIEWLKQYRIPHLIGGDGKPKVVRDTVLALLGPAKHVSKGPQLRIGKHAPA